MTLDQYINAFAKNNVGKSILTTIIIAVLSMVFSLIIGSMMAYPLAVSYTHLDADLFTVEIAFPSVR